MNLMSNRLDKWKKEGIPEFLADMIKNNIPLHRIYNHTKYTRVEILGAARMMGLKIPIRVAPLTSKQEGQIYRMIMKGYNYADMAERMGLGREVIRRYADELISYWPPARKRELDEKRYGNG